MAEDLTQAHGVHAGHGQPVEPVEYRFREDRGWVVVLFGSPGDEGCGVDPCPMSAMGPYQYHDEARTVAGQLPEWTKPHILMLRDRP